MEISQEIRSQVLENLAALEKENNITILLCVEAGSRAWNIPSIDSDYDVRFVYVHNDKRKYISCISDEQEEIVLEAGDLDIKGYDIRKAYRLILSGEVNVYEWLASPIVYLENKEKRWLIDVAASENFDVGSVARKYYGLLKVIYIRDMRWVDKVKVKKYLYSLRSIMCCRYVLEHNKPVPLDMEQLLESMPIEYKEELDALLKLKSETVDNYQTPRSVALEDKVLQEITKLEGLLRGRWPELNKKPDKMDALLLKYIQEG